MEQESARVCTDQAESFWETALMSSPSRPELVQSLRLQIKEFLNSPSFTPEELSNVELAVGEACSNALKHGSPRGALDEVRVKCMKRDSTLIVEVSDNGMGFDPSGVLRPVPEEMREGGMGIFLMRTLMDSVEFKFDGGTTVRLTKHHR